jgi:endonuclease/exonuclease/phosphatase family metal-dependent hydrolase
MTVQLKLCTYNVLAPCWADPSIYPLISRPHLDKDKRRVAIIRTLVSLAQTHDIIALQETQEDEISYYKEELKKEGFLCFSVNHDDNYWARYITVDPPFVSNGVAVFWNARVVDMLTISGCSFSNKGNRGIIGTFRKNNKVFRVVCAHLDSDTGGARAKESKSLISQLPPLANTTDFILGDLNFTVENGPYNNIFNKANFVSIMKYLGKEEMTHPFDISYGGNDNYGIIDHILVRGAVPINGEVITFGVYQDAQTVDERISLLLQRNGSDHFIVSGLINIG